MDRASATEAVGSGLIPIRVKANTCGNLHIISQSVLQLVRAT